MIVIRPYGAAVAALALAACAPGTATDQQPSDAPSGEQAHPVQAVRCAQ